MASYNIDNAPSNLTMPDFAGFSAQFGSLAKSCKFMARIVTQGRFAKAIEGDMARQLVYLCEATEFPGRGLMSVDTRYYGPSFKLPFQSTYEDISMTFLCRSRSMERQFFDDWMNEINPVNTFDFRYRDDYKCNIELFQYSDDNKPSYAFTLLDAWPTVVNPQQVTWADDQFMRLGVSFTYHYWIRKGRDYQNTATNPLVPDSEIRK